MRRWIPVLALGLVQFGATTAPAGAIPPFARRYKVSCNLCHSPAPRLNAFGEQFAANGFMFAPGEEPRDTIATVVRAGADTLVAGSAVFGAHDRSAEVRSLRELALEAQAGDPAHRG